MDKDKIEMKTMMESAAVAEYLTALAKGFKSGCITVEKDGESLTLTPAGSAEVEIEARVKKDKARFSLEVTWRMAQEQDDSASLKISAEAPKADTAKETMPDKKAEKKDGKPSDMSSGKAVDAKDAKDGKKVEAPADSPVVKVIAAAPAVKPVAPTAPASTSGVKPTTPPTSDSKA